MLPPPPPPMSSIPRGPDSAKSSTWSYRPGFGNPNNLVPLGRWGNCKNIFRWHKNIYNIQRPSPWWEDKARENQSARSSLPHTLRLRGARGQVSGGGKIFERQYKNILSPCRPASQNTASAMTIADLSPKLALQRLLMLYENGEHRSVCNRASSKPSRRFYNHWEGPY